MATRRSGQGLRAHTLALVLTLVLEFLLGMWVNLFVAIPSHHPGVTGGYLGGAVAGVFWALLHGAWVLRLHVALAIVLFLMAVAQLARTVRTRSGGALGWSVVGLVGLIGAGFNGASFLNYGHNFSSMLMSVGFALAFVGYLFALETSAEPVADA